MTRPPADGNGSVRPDGAITPARYVTYDIPMPAGLFRRGWARYLYPSIFLRYTTICTAVAYDWGAARLQTELAGIGFTPGNEEATPRDRQRVDYCFRIYRQAGIEPPRNGRDEVRVLEELGLIRARRRGDETTYALVLPVPGPEDVLNRP